MVFVVSKNATPQWLRVSAAAFMAVPRALNGFTPTYAMWRYPPGRARRHAVLLVDQAGWHLRTQLVVPDNITIVPPGRRRDRLPSGTDRVVSDAGMMRKGGFGRAPKNSPWASSTFREQMLPQYARRFEQLALTQEPDTLFVTCSDSRVVPHVLASTEPGDLFTLRNVGNLVPPATAEGISTGDLSEASAIEYAVLVLKVANIVVCGHSECGAMKSVMARSTHQEAPNLAKWLHHAHAAAFQSDTRARWTQSGNRTTSYRSSTCSCSRAPDVLSDRAGAGGGPNVVVGGLVVRGRVRHYARLRTGQPILRGDRHTSWPSGW